MTTSYLTVVLIFIYYFIGWSSRSQLNVIDIGLLGWLRRKTKLRPSRNWEPVVCKTILLFADQQLITGSAILGAAYSQLRCGLQSYHWQIIIYLAWLSSLSHLTALTALRRYFQKHPTIRAWRVALMLCMALALIVALLPTGHVDWFWLKAPAICTFMELAPALFEADAISTTTMIISLLVLIISYATRILKLFPGTATLVYRWIRAKPGGVGKALLDSTYARSRNGKFGKSWTAAYLLLLALFLELRVVYDFYDSILWEVHKI